MEAALLGTYAPISSGQPTGIGLIESRNHRARSTTPVIAAASVTNALRCCVMVRSCFPLVRVPPELEDHEDTHHGHTLS